MTINERFTMSRNAQTISVVREQLVAEIPLVTAVKGRGPMEVILRELGKAIDNEGFVGEHDALKFEFEDSEFVVSRDAKRNPLADFDEFALQEELRRRAEQMGSPAIEDVWNEK